MPASLYEYKTVALPQTVQGKRRRGVSEADFVAEMLGELIHIEAVDGWEYMRSDILAAGSRGGMFMKEPKVTYYSVLVFRRAMEDVWPITQPDAGPQRADTGDAAIRARNAVSPQPQIKPRPHPAAAAAPKPTPPREAVIAPSPPPPPPPPAIDDPTSPLAQGGILSTGGQIRADGGAAAPAIVERPAPRPPLGSAQD